MEILKIKHHLLIDGTWETLILENNEPRVYVQKNVLYDRILFVQLKEVLPYGQTEKAQLTAIFEKDWSQYN